MQLCDPVAELQKKFWYLYPGSCLVSLNTAMVMGFVCVYVFFTKNTALSSELGFFLPFNLQIQESSLSCMNYPFTSDISVPKKLLPSAGL